MKALTAWLATAARTGDPVAAARAAAEAVADDPWRVVREAGALARRELVAAPGDLGLTPALRRVSAGTAGAVTVPAGAPWPGIPAGRAARGAWDTPVDLARRVVAAAGTRASVLDPACGTGALLLAAHEAGAGELWGTDLDRAALAVAAVAVPRARLACADALAPGEPVDGVVCNPPFVAAELQRRVDRDALRRRWPWLAGRFDLSVAVIAAASERVRPGGGLGLIVPASLLFEPYAAALRRRWLTDCRISTLGAPERFPGVAVRVAVIGLRPGEAGPLPSGTLPAELLSLPNAPLDAGSLPGDAALLARACAASVRLGDLATIDTGVVAHGRDGGKARRLHDAPAPGRVPYADAREFFAGARRWLDYDPAKMHRAKRPALFEAPKVVVQRIRQGGPVKAVVDRTGVYVGHTCNVVVPREVPPAAVAALLTDPVAAGLLRIANGLRLDLYPHDLAELPFPRAWLAGVEVGLCEAWGLDPEQSARLRVLAATARLQ